MKEGDSQQIKTFMEDNGIKVSGIDKMSHDESKFNSYKVFINKYDIDKVFDDYFWPAGVQCKIWSNRATSKNRRNDDQTE